MPMINTDLTATARKYIHEKYGELPVPPKGYIILMAPRSGSNLLCADLQRFGFGNPIEGLHANIKRLYALGWRIDFSNPYEHLRQVLEFGTQNNIFGLKMNWYQFRTWLPKMRGLIGPLAKQLNNAEVLDVFFPNVSYVHLKRRDKLKQAVSYAKGIQTGVWKIPVAIHQDIYQYAVSPVYLQPLIEACFDDLIAMDVAWDDYLQRFALPHLEVWYEDVVSDYAMGMLRLYDYLGLVPPETPEPQTKKLANRQSTDWVKRFEEETPWLKDSELKNALSAGDFHTVMTLRYRMLSSARREYAWVSSWAYRSKTIRLYFKLATGKVKRFFARN